MTDLKRILLVEDSGNDVELTLAAFEENHIANEVVVARDGQEALDYLYRRGIFKLRAEGNPAVVLLDPTHRRPGYCRKRISQPGAGPQPRDIG